MTLSCRHCYGKDEFVEQASEAASSFQTPASYVERLVYGSGDESTKPHIQSVLEWVESYAVDGVPMPGIVVWCHSCRKMSVISYTYYLFLSKEQDRIPDSKILSLSAYYTRMCMGAETWMHMIALHDEGNAAVAAVVINN